MNDAEFDTLTGGLLALRTTMAVLIARAARAGVGPAGFEIEAIRDDIEHLLSGVRGMSEVTRSTAEAQIDEFISGARAIVDGQRDRN